MNRPVIEVSGARVEVGPSIVLAASERLVAAAALEDAPEWALPGPGTLEATARLLSGGRLAPGTSPLDAARALATVYGGLILVYLVDGVPVPLARLPPTLGGLGIEPPGACTPVEARDGEVLEWWARSAASGRLEGSGCTHAPRGAPWRAPGPYNLAPVGYRVLV